MEEQKETPVELGDNPIADALTAAANPDTGAEELVEEPKVDPIGRTNGLADGTYHWGTGRRKNARARVRIRPGSGQFVVNGKPMNEFFVRGLDQAVCMGPLETIKVSAKVDVFVNAEGGGMTGQAGAVRMGLGRALIALYPDAERSIRDANHTSRDPRMVERKKPGRHGARRGHQWGKR
ncbi:MAG: 30S ribosomal protein S9 [Planctomycetes bacterium]|jgi:small subunit ribosomal protein S9|nr:30S ribosomal protein S9 [Planctomycetota bacterium]MBT4028807.1 30S ribosomal protein S9 [Planctomycetota bacterium]MBT4559633.1 30S ribosomal protein S9 [Planctomycetota bacterium]MBT5102033.1 30S ribosomal protein S9 [Planctomycetota bacterium]MBT7012910.1 30S ribosomal protein S9 [Planctomycetota bacterium]